MNAHQTPTATHASAQLLPVTDIRPGSLVVVKADGSTIAERVGSAQGGQWGTVISATHVRQGIVRFIVKHADAAHPTGCSSFEVDATERYVAKRAL